MIYQGCIIKPMTARRPLTLATVGMKFNSQAKKKIIGYTPLCLLFRRSREAENKTKQQINYVLNNGQKVEIAPRLAFTLVWIEQIKTLFDRYQNRVKSDVTRENSSVSYFQQLLNSHAVFQTNYSLSHTLNNPNKYHNSSSENQVAKYLTNIYRHNSNYFTNHSNGLVSRIKQLVRNVSYKNNIVNSHQFKTQNTCVVSNSVIEFNKWHEENNNPSYLQKNSQTIDDRINKSKLLHSIDYSAALVNRKKPSQDYQGNLNAHVNKNLNHNKEIKSAVPVDVVYRVDKPHHEAVEKKAAPAETKSPPKQVAQIDIDKITRDVINKIDKKIRIERERRGL